MNRKLKKLFNHPYFYFRDFFDKLINRIKLFFYKRTTPVHNSYSIVSGCYNVGQYLDDFFASLVCQSLSFEDHIYCIMVDDGSTDNTADVIKSWKKKFPSNIFYIRKNNEGQASARNLGLDSVKTEWVTFTDPDDFLDPDYFLNIDYSLSHNNNIAMVSSNIVFYHEDKNIFRFNHPLNYKYSNNETILHIRDLNSFIQLSASSAFFRMSLIKLRSIRFNVHIKPHFEDAHFLNTYLMDNFDRKAVFLKHAKYYYRKRSDLSSSIDRSWKDKRNYLDVLRYGYLDLLSRNIQNIDFIKYLVMYDLSWYIKYLLNKPERVSFLSASDKDEFLYLLEQCFKFISYEELFHFELKKFGFFYKFGILHCFKQMPLPPRISRPCHILKYDIAKDEVLISFSYDGVLSENYWISGNQVFPKYTKNKRNDFLGQLFSYDRWVWLPLEHRSGILSIFIGGFNANITVFSKFMNYIDLDSLRFEFRRLKKVDTVRKDCWLFIDKDSRADDNAEHLYRWVKKCHPEIQCYFALNKDSSDWDRLECEGFKLVPFLSFKYKEVLNSCTKIISSHIDQYIVDPFRDGSTKYKQFIFLQHGVTKDNISMWLNSKNIDLFITASNREYRSIVDNNSQYKFTEKEVKLTGFPRHDSLIKKDNVKNVILVMPTWRNNIVGSTIVHTSTRLKNPDFMNTDFAMSWSNFLKSDKLRMLSVEYHYEVCFFPHPNIQIYIEDFELPSYIKLGYYSRERIQDVFMNGKILITDYSSVAFEMAYLSRAILYYQFDEKSVFDNFQHIVQKGYFDYRRDGFGPVCISLEDLIYNLEEILRNNGLPNKIYEERMANTFAFHDNHNCERVYNAILDLDKP